MTRPLLSLLIPLMACGSLFGQAEAPPAPPPAPPAPPPGEEVMRPTQNGLRLTPTLARAFSLGWINQRIGDRGDLSRDQVRDLSTRMSERMVRMSRESGGQTQQFFEGLFETMLESEGGDKMTPELAKKLADRTLPVIPRHREFLHGVLEDARPVLSAEQMTQLEGVVRREEKKLDGVGEVMQRWTQGDYRKEDRPLQKMFDDGPDDEDEPAQAGSANGAAPASKPSGPQMRHARRMASWELNRLGPTDWQRFAAVVKTSLHYTPEQSQKADALLVEYRAKADAIMTPAWKASARRNRTQVQMRYQLTDQPLGPWLFHLDREWRAMREPVVTLGREFCTQVLAIATEEQRTTLINELATRADAHGLTLTDADRVILLSALK